MALTQRQIDMRSGHEGTFWKNVVKHDNGRWEWIGFTNNNHNTVDCDSYDYGVFELCSRETANDHKPKKIHASSMAHRVVLFLTYGRPVPSPNRFYVFPYNGDHLDINPANLGVRDIKTGTKVTAAEFFEVANDNNTKIQVAV